MRCFFQSRWTLLLLLMTFAVTAFASGPVEQVLHSFTGAPDGANPLGVLVADKTGNLYGTTWEGGVSYSEGAVFQLSPQPGGGWVETIIYRFLGGTPDGAEPQGGLTFDNAGNLYGTTTWGGGGLGTVFELSPPTTQSGAWTETLLFTFPADRSKGLLPSSKLTFDGVGNLYGTTPAGGETGANAGTAFQLKPPTVPGGTWTLRVLYNFGAFSGDGINPGRGALALRAGALYGTTTSGGTNGVGTVFQLVQENGVWSENILYNFALSATDGAVPDGNLIFDQVGNVYGTTIFGGVPNCSRGCGTVYQLSSPSVAGSSWHESILHYFRSRGDGSLPSAGLIRDNAGNLYGTAAGGDLAVNKPVGVVFRLKPPAIPGGTWTEVPLHHFNSIGDGSVPVAELIYVNGSLCGTTELGGASDLGSVFCVVP
jgi:uncharacterized repeat protein (TIGR03803 family)